jgi:hypothetical protein
MDTLNANGVGVFLKNQEEVMTTALDLFKVPTKDPTLKEVREYEVRPTTDNSEGPFYFMIPSQPSLYIDPGSFRLKGEVCIKKVSSGQLTNLEVPTKAGTVRGGDWVTPCNFFPASLFKNAEVDFNGKSVTYVNSPLLHFKSVIESLLSYGSDAARTHLYNERCKLDDPDKYEDIDSDSFKARRKWIEGSKYMDFNAPLHLDVLNVDKYFPDGLDVNIKFQRERDSFSLIVPTGTTTEYKIIIRNLSLYFRRVVLGDAVYAEHARLFAAGHRAYYPITRNTLRAKTIFPKEESIRFDNLFQGTLPETLIMCVLDGGAYAGNIHKNPFHFQNYDMREVALTYNGKSIPGHKLEMDFDNDRFCNVYRHLYDNLGIHHNNTANLVTPEQFKDGLTFFAFDFTPDRCYAFHPHPLVKGVISVYLTVRHADTHTTPMTVIFYASYQDVFEIDGDRQVYITATTTSV